MISFLNGIPTAVCDTCGVEATDPILRGWRIQALPACQLRHRCPGCVGA